MAEAACAAAPRFWGPGALYSLPNFLFPVSARGAEQCASAGIQKSTQKKS